MNNCNSQTRTDVNITMASFFMTPMDDCACADAYKCEFYDIYNCFTFPHAIPLSDYW